MRALNVEIFIFTSIVIPSFMVFTNVGKFKAVLQSGKLAYSHIKFGK